jgi:uncharacterized membrane protein
MGALAERPGSEVLPSQRSTGVSGKTNRDGKKWVRSSVIVQADPKKLYEIWRNVESAPAWHERIAEVRRTGTSTSHWVMRDQRSGKTVAWDFEILVDEPEQRITWRSLSGDPESAGEVIFEPAPGGRGTLVTLLERFRRGKLTRAWEMLTGRRMTVRAGTDEMDHLARV